MLDVKDRDILIYIYVHIYQITSHHMTNTIDNLFSEYILVVVGLQCILWLNYYN